MFQRLPVCKPELFTFIYGIYISKLLREATQSVLKSNKAAAASPSETNTDNEQTSDATTDKTNETNSTSAQSQAPAVIASNHVNSELDKIGY